MTASDWTLLPDPLLIGILQQLDVFDVLSASRTCVNWSLTARDDYLWCQLFRRDFGVSPDVSLRAGASSWYDEYKRLVQNLPLVLTDDVKGGHAHQVLHVSSSRDGSMFATCSKDGQLIVWNSGHPVSVKYTHDMKAYNWMHTQYSEFNASSTLIMVSGVYKGTHQTTAGEIAVFTVDGTTSHIRLRVVNRPFDIFGTWLGDGHLLSGDLQWLAHLVSSTVLRLNRVNEQADADLVPEMRTLYRFCNRNASSMRALLVAEVDVAWRQAFGLPVIGDDGGRETEAIGTEDLAQIKSSDEEDGTGGDGNGRRKGARLLIFLTGSSTFSPHEIGFKFIGKGAADSLDAVRTVDRDAQNSTDRSPTSAYRFDQPDRCIDLRGHIVGMALSPDHTKLYVNLRRWPLDWRINNVLEPPPISVAVEMHVIDLQTLQQSAVRRRPKRVGPATPAPEEFTSTAEAFFLIPNASEHYVASGSEDERATVWDRHYGVPLAKYRHADVVNSVAFVGGSSSSSSAETLVTVGDDYTIKVWRSLERSAQLGCAEIDRAVREVKEN